MANVTDFVGTLKLIFASGIFAGAGVEGFLSTELANSLVISDVTNFANLGIIGFSAGNTLGAGVTLIGGIDDGNGIGSSEYEWNIGCC